MKKHKAKVKNTAYRSKFICFALAFVFAFTAHCPLPAAHCSLPNAHCKLQAVNKQIEAIAEALGFSI